MLQLLAVLVLLTPATFTAQGQPAGGDPAQTVEEVRASLAEYVEAFNRGDAAAVAGFWAEDADYQPIEGDRVSGRKAIEDLYRRVFEAGPGVRVDVADVRVEPATEGWAYETGTDVLTYPDGTVEESGYRALLRKVDGKWMLQSVEDLDSPAPISHAERMVELEWLIGGWRDETEGVNVETSYTWTPKRNSIRGEMKASVDGEIEREALIMIGWDPIEETYRSWTFDSDGGTTEGVWYEKGGKWFAKSLYVLPDGETASSTRVLERIDGDTLRWRAVNREIDGEILPAVGPITLKRVAAQH